MRNIKRVEDVDDIVKCKECGSRDLKTDSFRGELFCQDCGLVLAEDLLEETSSGKEKSGDPNSIRVNEPNKQGYLLGSMVGNRLTGGELDRSKLGRKLRTYDKRSTPNHLRSQQKGIMACRMLLADMQAPDTLKEQVIWNYKRLLKNNKMTGIPLDVRAAALVYFTYRDNGIRMSIEEISSLNASHPRQVAKMARRIATAFQKPWVLSQRNLVQDIEKYCNKMQMDRATTNAALQISVPIEQMGEALCLQMGYGFTAAIIYLAIRLTPNGSFRTQRDIAETCKITEVTLRNNFNTILNNLNLDKNNFNDGYYTLDDITNGAYKNEEE
jgi:transcription initiation factor TFIIB